MNFVEAVKSGYQNYVNFSGRSSRSAFWWWALFQVIVSIVIGSVEGGGQASMGDGMMMSYNAGPIAMIWSLANLLPGLAVSVRRMHDIDKSGWWVLINLIPLVGWIIYIVWACQKGTSGQNRFGADPLAA
jgi:uncharacterized membrane protein YhaH (DUF805 family)